MTRGGPPGRLRGGPLPEDPGERRAVQALRDAGEPPRFEGARLDRGWRRLTAPRARRRRLGWLALTLVSGVAAAAIVRRVAAPPVEVAPAPPRAQRPAIATPAPRAIIVSSRCEAVPYVDPRQQTVLGPADRSHWLSPWRAWSDTWPASRVRDAVALSIAPGPSASVEARLFAAAGIRRALTHFAWDWMSYDDPTRMLPGARASYRATLRALAQAGLRPLITVGAHRTGPGPRRRGTVTLTAGAPRGAREIRLAPGEEIVPGRTGLDGPDGVAAQVLILDVTPDGRARLSRPLPAPLAAGRHPVSTLRYLPLSRPRLADGRERPEVEETVAGWLTYVAAAAREAREVFGPGGFDVQIWDDVLADGDFLDAGNYHDPPLDDRPGTVAEVTRLLLERTIALLRDPRQRLGAIGIVDGFANTRFGDAADTALPGTTALGRHVSARGLRFPDAALGLGGRGLDATGRADGETGDAFVPRYDVLMPEVALTAILPAAHWRAGQLFRDLSPLPSVGPTGATHGRGVSRAEPSLEVWVTAASLNLEALRRWRGGPLDDDERLRLHAKAALRTVAAHVGSGARVVGLYTVAGSPDVSGIDRTAPDGGPVLRAIGAFLRPFQSAAPAAARALRVDTVASCSEAVVFEGDGTPRHPPLRHRDLIAVFPFHRHAGEFVVAAYVMTRDLSAAAAALTSTLRLSSVDGRRATARAFDPLTGQDVPVRVVARGADVLELELALVDHPRVITIAE